MTNVDNTDEESSLAEVFFRASPETTRILIEKNLFTMGELREYIFMHQPDRLVDQQAHEELKDILGVAKFLPEGRDNHITIVGESIGHIETESEETHRGLPTNNEEEVQALAPIPNSSSEQEIWSLTLSILSVRSRNALVTMGVSSPDGLLELDLDKLEKQRSVGKKTFSEIRNAQAQLTALKERQNQDPQCQPIYLPADSILKQSFADIASSSLSKSSNAKLVDILPFDEVSWERLEGMGIAFRDDPLDVWMNAHLSQLAFRRIPSWLLRYSWSSTAPFDHNRIIELANDAPIFDVERSILVRIGDLPISRSSRLVLTAARRTSLGEINGLSEREILLQYGLSPLSLALMAVIYTIRGLIAPEVLRIGKLLSQDLTSSSDNLLLLIEAIFGKYGKDTRSANVLFLRHFQNTYRENTLEVLANEYNVTRERIRQIESKALAIYQSPAFATHIYRLIDAIQEQLSLHPIQDKDSFAEGVCERIGYKPHGDHHGFAAIARKIEHVEYDSRIGYVFIKAYKCAKCESVDRLIREQLPTPLSEIRLDEVLLKLKAYCESVSCTATPSLNLVEYAAKKSDGLEIQGGLLRYSAERRGSRTIIDHAVETICLGQPQGMHFLDIANALRLRYPHIKFDDDRMAHIWASKNKSLILWDRGTFIHRQFVKLDDELMKQIHDWLCEKLKIYKVQFVSGSFRHFKDRLLEIGVRSETALYSAIRIKRYSDLTMPKYPHIYLTSEYEGRITTAALLEDFLERCGEATTLEKIRRYAVGNLGMKMFRMAQGLAESNYILRYSYSSYIHSKYIPIRAEEMEMLLAYAERMASKYGHLSAEAIFDEKEVTCRSLGINSGILLYSVFSSISPDTITLGGYPIISVNRSGAMNTVGVVERVIEHIGNKAAPCTLQELEDHFCSKLGYKKQCIGLARQSQKIFRYSTSSVVHLDTLGGKTVFDKVIEIAIEKFDTISRWNGKWASIEDLINIGLPPLTRNIQWTNTLLTAILERCPDIALIGTGKINYTIFDDNRNARCSLGYVINRILEDKFNGAARVQEIETELRALGFVAGSLTNSILQGCAEVVQRNNVVMISRLAEDAEGY